MSKTYSQRETAKIVGVSYGTIGRWIKDGKIPDVARKPSSGYRVFAEEDVRHLIEFASGVKEPRLSYSPVKAHSQYSVASFFSGIGGFDLGFQDAGIEITFQCEVEPFCSAILEHHWSNVPRWGDITTLDHATVPFSDIWVGGFPCQDLSLARMGKRDGLRGSKSRLFHEFARLVGEGKPRVLVIENVAGLLSSHEGRDFGVLLQTLAELGYAVGWRTLNSKYFGVPQSRQRVYIVGCRGDWRGPAAILFERERGERDTSTRGQDGKKPPSPFKTVVGDPGGEGPVIQSIAYCLYATSARHTGTDWSRNYVCYPAKGEVRRLTPRECEGVMAFPSNWTLPVNSSLKGDDLDSARYHALGNAVTPPVARWLGERIKLYLQDVDRVTGTRRTDFESRLNLYAEAS